MAREDKLSRGMNKGLCGALCRDGTPCENIKGECRAHATGDQRCKSCLDAAPERQCSLANEPGADYCIYHAHFPHMGRKLKDYAEVCRQAGVPFVPDGFFSVHYPGKTDRPPCNLHALVGALLCLPSSSRDSVPVASGHVAQPCATDAQSCPTVANLAQPCPTLRNLAQPCSTTEQAVELPADTNRQPQSWSLGARAERRHKLQVKRALERGGLTLDPEEQTTTRRLIESVEAEVTIRCAQTDLRRGVWRQAAPQRLRSHVTTEASRVVTEVRQGIVEELDKRFPLPDNDLRKLREEKHRIETAIRNKQEEQKKQNEAENAKKEAERQAKRESGSAPSSRKRTRPQAGATGQVSGAAETAIAT